MKKTMLKRSAAALLAGAMVCTLAACGDGTQTADGKVPIKMFITDRSDAPMSDDMMVFQQLNEKCGVDIQLELAPSASADAKERFNLLMASDEIPDVVVYKLDELNKYTKAFAPLNDLIDQHAPNIKKAIEEDETTVRDLTALDGNIYTLAKISPVKTANVYFARKDWMDKLGIEEPKTLDEFYNMLVKFRDGDPNGNGEKDEIPYTTRSKKSGLMNFAEAFGIREEYFVEDGTVKYGAIDPRMKDVLTFLNKMYTEKLVDTEYPTLDNKQWQARVTNEQSGVLHDWVSRIDFFNQLLEKTNPEGKFTALLPPTQGDVPVGTWYQMTRARDDGAAAISKASKNKEAVIKMFDYIFSDEGMLLTNFGLEGDTYTMESGDPVYTDKILKNSDGKAPQIALYSEALTIDWPMVQDMRYEKQLLSPEAGAARDKYEPIIRKSFPKLKFTDAERSEISAKMGDITTYKDEMMDKFITGTEPISNFDNFVQQLKTMGIDEVLGKYNSAYQKYLSN